MIYSLLLLTATGMQAFGSYNNLSECQNAAQEFKQQNIPAGCVRKESYEESMARAQIMMKNLMQMIPVEK